MRGILVSLAVFGTLYCLFSILVVAGWTLWTSFRNRSVSGAATPLFLLRVSPLLASAFIMLAFAAPAFIFLEPHSIDEDIGTIAFGFSAATLFAAGLFRILIAHTNTSRILADWMDGAVGVDTPSETPMFQIKPASPPLLLIGISSPRVLISESAVGLLNKDELRLAVRHEIEHVRSRDNLKKLIVGCLPFPGMASLDHAWQQAAEFAADDAAVSTQAEAIDLAAALIKLSELAPFQDSPAFTTGLVDVSRSISLRVSRLLSWKQHIRRHTNAVRYTLLPVIVGLVLAGTHYRATLVLTHRLTEWFIH